MAKKDQAAEEIEPQIEQPKEDAMAKKDDDSAPAAPSLQGLVKMHRHGVFMHAHPTTIAHHTGNGWKPV